MKLARQTAKINTYLLINLFFSLFMTVLALTTPHDWFKKFAAFLVIQSEDSFSYTFSRASGQVHLGCFPRGFPLRQTDRSEISGNNRGKWNGCCHFKSKSDRRWSNFRFWWTKICTRAILNILQSFLHFNTEK